MLKKLTLAAVVALGALALLASAAQANKALEPLTEHKPFEGKADVKLHGNAGFGGGLGGIAGTLDVTVEFQGGSSTGKVSAVEITNPNAFGLIAPCTVVKAEAVGLPWVVHAEETTGENPVKRFSITEPEFIIELEGFLCPPTVNITGGLVYATPDNATSISDVTLGGFVKTTVGNANPFGTLDATPKKHFGIG